MKFKLKSIPGKSRKKYKEYWDETKTYRIVWLKEAFGVGVPPHYFTTIKIVLPDGRTMMDFVGKKGTYKTFKKAVAAAEEHRTKWLKAEEATGIRDLENIFGKLPFGIPVKVKLKRNVFEIISTQYESKRNTRSHSGRNCEPSG